MKASSIALAVVATLMLVFAQAVVLGDEPAAPTLTPVTLQDFEKANSLPKLFVVNIPNENASVALSTEHPFDGKQCVKLHYHFTGDGQYLGLAVPVRARGPLHKLHFQLFGDSSGSGYGVYLNDATGQTHKYRDAGKMKIDFQGWKELTVDLDGGHEHWGGANNGKIVYPIKEITFEISNPGHAIESDLYLDAVAVDSELSAEETLSSGLISVVTPAYCSDIKGSTTVQVCAVGYKTLTVKCWKQGPGFGANSTVATVDLDAKGNGSFVLPADDYPHGPLTVTISGGNATMKDNCYLQLYNKGGVSWNEGMPKEAPAAAEGMALVFADDFTAMPTMGDDAKSTYFDHKPPHGSQDFSSIPFTSLKSPNNPFTQVDSYLRIRADAKKNSAGLISSAKSDGTGVLVSVPCYFECRFIGPNAVGSWPAFWLLTDNLSKPDIKGCDELDIIEAYGGEGPGSPGSFDAYQITPHRWSQGKEGDAMANQAYKDLRNPCRMYKFGVTSTWYEAFHTYGCKVTATDTIYYLDNIEVGRHATFPVCQQRPLFFLINLATGGGWPVDLSRYDGKADMYVDFVRVYAGKK